LDAPPRSGGSTRLNLNGLHAHRVDLSAHNIASRCLRVSLARLHSQHGRQW
jgi:hypothetical protein